MIIDYSTARPSVSALKAAGVTAVGRYIGWDGVPGFASIGKNLMPSEAEHLLSHGFQIFIVFEYARDAALKGREQGLKDGTLAADQLVQLGAPPGVTVYFALDFDLKDYAPGRIFTSRPEEARARLGPAAAYFDGIHAALGPAAHARYRVGVYGGYYAVSRVLDAGLAVMAWQTIAWSGGQWDDRAVLRQELGTPLPGADLDKVRLNTVHGPDFGQWPRPKPAPAEYVTHVSDGTETAHDLSTRHDVSVTRMLTDTLRHFRPAKANAPELYAWLNAAADPESFVNLKAPPPAGVTFRVPRLPS
jgi:Rv2525c-like, glycoside hydrolase-like domain